MFNYRSSVIALVVATSLGACSTQPGSQNINQFGGTILGGAGGGFLGSKIGKGSGNLAATAAGAVGGALLGNVLGSNMDKEANDKTIARDRALHQPIQGYGQPSYMQPTPGAGMVYTGPADPCGQYRSNEGALAACQRGLSQRARDEQRRLENDAYSKGLSR